MPQLYLPLEHTESDLVLAGQVAEAIGSDELFVTWTREHGRAVPEVVAMLREPVARSTGTLAIVFQVVRELWAVLLNRPPQPARLAAPAADAQPTQPKPAG